jgi:hypothetical protein
VRVEAERLDVVCAAAQAWWAEQWAHGEADLTPRHRPDPEGTMRHLGILAHSAEGAALCFRAFCQEGFARLGPHEHPDVTLDCIALARSMPAWDGGDRRSIRATLAVSVERLAAAGADFFVCPDNTAHMALEEPGPDLALPGLHIAEVVADRAAAAGSRRVGVLGTRYLMDARCIPEPSPPAGSPPRSRTRTTASASTRSSSTSW